MSFKSCRTPIVVVLLVRIAKTKGHTFLKCVAYINELECPPQYIADMLRDLADAIMTSYPEVKNNSSNL